MALHLKFALNLDTIADEMIKKISDFWKSPFDAPTIVFPEYKLDQWFRFKWMERKGVLANLNKKSIDRFLFEILGGDNRKVKKLSPDMLRNVIIAYLRNLAAKGFDAFRAKLSDRVANYLFTADGESGRQVDDFRLFDFANKLSGLFLEYEISRPSKFIRNASGDWVPGILDRWKQGALEPFFCKNGEPVENEEWERNLYSAIFHNAGGKSLLTEVFEKMDKDCTYLTLPFMYEACKKNGSPKFHFESKMPVFIFGLSGMGQFYRVVLQEFSKSHDVYAYIQNPCMEFWEDLKKNADWKSKFYSDDSPDEESDDVAANENALLKAWGFAGRDSIKLWNLANDYRDGFSDAELYESEKKMDGRENASLLHEIQRMIANRTNKFSENFSPRKVKPDVPFSGLEDKSLTITAAPNRIREVEAVHSQICQLLNDGANIRDILVVCPRLSDYRSAICQVFDQCEKGTENGVRLPFVFVDSAAEESFAGNALENLFSIKKNRSLDRVEFFSLVRNPVVQAARKISPDEVSNWESWVSGMNVYRDHVADSNKREDWLCGVKRLLLARLTEDCVADEYLPYAEMSSADDSSLDRFAEAVESLESWIRNVAAPTENDMDEVRRFLNSWLLMADAPNGFAGESIIWEKVLNALDGLNAQFAAGVKDIPWDMVGQTLLSAAQTSEYSCGNVLVGGITFMKFAPNRTIPVKHLFFMGANAKDFPGEQSFDSLDLRKSVARFPGDDTVVAKNRYAFLCQLMSAGESFHISYQNMYLPKDAELYPSSVVNDLRKALKNALPKENVEEFLPTIKLKIDENRPNKELFTARERRNKRTIGDFDREEKVPPSTVVKRPVEKLPERVSVYGVRKFLEDPFEFQIDRVMRMEETGENPEKIDLEPISLNNLDKSVWLRFLVAEKLGIASESGKGLDKDLLLKKGVLPQGVFGDRIWADLDGKANQFVEKILETYPKDGWKFKSFKLDVPVERENSGWTLFGNVRMMAENGNGNAVLLDVKEKVGAETLIPNYVAALGLIASGNSTSVAIEVFGLDKEKMKSEKIELSIGCGEAKKRLNGIYEGMFGEGKNWKAIPVKLREMNSKAVNFRTRREYCRKVKDGWTFFAAKDLFDMKDLRWSGFGDGDDFLPEWRKSREEMEKLMPEIFEKLKSTKSSKNGGK